MNLDTMNLVTIKLVTMMLVTMMLVTMKLVTIKLVMNVEFSVLQHITMSCCKGGVYSTSYHNVLM